MVISVTLNKLSEEVNVIIPGTSLELSSSLSSLILFLFDFTGGALESLSELLLLAKQF